MIQKTHSSPSRLKKRLDFVEWAGNKAPHPGGVGTVVALMLPYATAIFVSWTLLFFAWYLLDLPFGPD